MLSPIKNFDIAGAIWYQGEANTSNNSVYAQLLTTMIDAGGKNGTSFLSITFKLHHTYGRKMKVLWCRNKN
jgi:hypothetical protein